jgi:hypothetical protein
MKRLFLFLMVTVLATTACSKRVSSEKIITQFSKHYDKVGDVYQQPLSGVSTDKRADYIMLKLGKDLGVTDIWSVDFDPEEGVGGPVVVAELKSRKKDAQMSMISACLDDADACSAVLDVLDAFKREKIRPAFALRAVFYYGGESGTDGLKAIAQDFLDENELAAFDIEVSSRDSFPERTFIIEDKLFFAEKVVEVLPQYLAPLGDVTVESGDYPHEGWPTTIPTYRYRLGSDRLTDLKLLTAFTFLLD